MMKGVAQFAAGMDLLDKVIGKWGKAVPVFGDLWSKWYKPMVDAAIKGLTKIAGLMEIKDREQVVGEWMIDDSSGANRDANGAPVHPQAVPGEGRVPGRPAGAQPSLVPARGPGVRPPSALRSTTSSTRT